MTVLQKVDKYVADRQKVVKSIKGDNTKYSANDLLLSPTWKVYDAMTTAMVDPNSPEGRKLDTLEGKAYTYEVMGMLAGALASGVMMAVMMSNAGGAWDNAKKYIEEGYYGGKGSEPHKAAVVGDTVGDPFKDTSGPSINILIKLMTIVAVVFAPLFVQIGGLL